MQSIFGFNETEGALRMMQAKLQQRTRQAMQDATMVIERASKENIAHGRTDWPVLSSATLMRRKDNRPLYDTGTLLRSIHSESEEMRAVIGSGLKYAPVHEFGSTTAGRSKNVTIPARPYLGPAFEENFRTVQEIFVRRLRGH